jgi:hypothetical protein
VDSYDNYPLTKNNDSLAQLDAQAMATFFAACTDHILTSVATHASAKTRCSFLFADSTAQCSLSHIWKSSFVPLLAGDRRLYIAKKMA